MESSVDSRINRRNPIYYQSLPKVDLHRHMEGSVRLTTLLEVRRAHGKPLPDTGKLPELVQVNPADKYTFENFLSKFQTLRMFYRTPEIIDRITRETIADAAADNVRYLELRFTPVALSRAENFPLSEVMDWVVNAARQAEQQYHVKTRLIASVNRQESLELAADVARLAAERLDKGIVGLDLAGNEALHTGFEFAGLFKEARQMGLHITIHAGEWNGSENVRMAIQELEAERIGHGVRVLEDPAVVMLARERYIPFEVCITSNLQSGVIPQSMVHPLPRMLSLGLNATVHTDDPSISQITLGNEYEYACENLGISQELLSQRIQAAAQASFLPATEKDQLIQSLQKELALI
jgi:adenosine deaminase